MIYIIDNIYCLPAYINTYVIDIFNIFSNYVLSLNNSSSYTAYYDSSDPLQPLVYSNLMFTTTGTNTLTLKHSDGTDMITYQIEVYNTPTDIVCFKENTKILTNEGYKCIENLKIGDLVQTYKYGFKKICTIGKDKILHKATNERIKDQLYKYSKEKYPQLLEELVITGGHSILIDNFTNINQLIKTKKIIGDSIHTINDKYRLPACVDEDAEIYQEVGIYTIYNIALESNNCNKAYGIYANGLLVESCSKFYLNEKSNMILTN